MSCTCGGDRDPLKELVEAAAGLLGYRLVEIGPMVTSQLAVLADKLSTELEDLPTAELQLRFEAYLAEEKRLEHIKQAWREEFDRRRPDSLPSEDAAPMPPVFQEQCSVASMRRQIAQETLRWRISAEALNHVLAGSTSDSATGKAESPNAAA